VIDAAEIAELDKEIQDTKEQVERLKEKNGNLQSSKIYLI
jgi:hypothetical protein